MRVIIASDFHLKFAENQEDKERRERVVSFLDSLIGKTDLLILNGDIFDLWFVWKNVIMKGYFPILKKLADLRESGCRIVFIAGNHDFWFRDFLTGFLDIEIYRHDFFEEIDGKKIYVSHGDLFTLNDLRYKIFRAIIRNKIIMNFYGILHPDLALGIGKSLSRTSRKQQASSDRLKKKETGLITFAKRKLDECDIVILGHSHLPKVEILENGIYANAGDWMGNSTYLEMNDGEIKLCEYSKKLKENQR
ncbi:MAG: UDP-2,3-diacylglucosamine diphosphatase [Candidatus Cloacimonetes bacterium]|nr:UDP-2,3-diacylglucosamine diphosphatase [Candidatus Cloacimonadota bacterium]